jgi:Uma2 family endonuclease
MVTSPTSSPTTSSDRTPEFVDRGWRIVEFQKPDGTFDFDYIPLTEEEFLHPQEGYRLPNSTFHDDIAGAAKDILTRRYARDPQVGVFRDLLIKWDIDLKDHCPDTFVAFNLQDKAQNRTEFNVTKEGTRPALIIEVVSPSYRKADRKTKVLHYARARVQEYVIIDRRTRRGQVLYEILGYRWVEGVYQPIDPDEEGLILCETVGLRIGLQDGCLVMKDSQTGERLLTARELEATNQELEATNQELEAAKTSAQQQAEAMAALLAQYRERFGDLSSS